MSGTTPGSRLGDMYPPELLSTICAHVYDAGSSPPVTSLDPQLHSEGSAPTSLPSSYPPAHWAEGVSRRTLANLCLVNRAWYEAAKPWLWRKVEIRLPRSWLSLVEEIAGGDDEDVEEEQTAFMVGQTIHNAENAVLATRDLLGAVPDKATALQLHEKVLERLGGPDGSIPPELLTPLASRDPSPRRLRPKSKSPARWKMMRSISDAIRNVMEHDNPGMYVPLPNVPHAGQYVRHLDFNHFRTIGMRRSVEEGVNNRFVTGDRLESVLKEMPNLVAFGATEYMDGALTFPVLKELLLRGSASRGRGRPSRGRDLVVFDPNDAEDEERERRRECKELDAIDLTGCVSAVFVNALTQFVEDHLIDRSTSDSDAEDDTNAERGKPRSRNAMQEPLIFPGLQRLGLRGVKSVQPHILNSFVLAFPCLTHLDLSCTRITPEVLAALGTSPTIRLQSLALERCNWLTGESIRDFLINAPAAKNIRELTLYGDWTFPSPLSTDDLDAIFSRAPCFTSGELVYLDLSSAPVTKEHLLNMCASQPHLRSLGLSYIRNLELDVIAKFLKEKAPNVEVLTLVTSSPELGYGAQVVTARQAPMNLHAHIIRPLCTPPFSFSLTAIKKTAQPPTRLRVVELATPLLASLGAGADSWRVIKSKGGRGWYVDTGSGWMAELPASGGKGCGLRRNLPREHPWRVALERLADANGNVSSGIGWHARKMEVLQGHGLLGREAGLYGAVSFAYQG
ncbi:uncharacterized protein LAESUDRAFT_724604 [Laetiporus sulphureus 93-53]|uniref:Uncharacterized protein n=1 Tax=Laetiporus sulphureus 93-53 TaxID=1314785 RepID=A0A165ERU2_9APHY|nr:uncharacterized protein LAESUDRAFT_724604 [Laetiporus sulphureus 93-53]KZT07635.1 hypothetical protein LAESUDRAFT_724604 [Laetiporus sulphureus 93-53]